MEKNSSTIDILPMSDHILFFGSTGLIGSSTLEILNNINFYLSNIEDIQNIISQSEQCNLSDTPEYLSNKIIYCLNRREVDIFETFAPDYESLRSIPLKFKDSRYWFDIGNFDNNTKRIVGEKGSLKCGNDNQSHSYRIFEQYYALDYVPDSDVEGYPSKLKISFHLAIVQLILPDSSQWADKMQDLFSGCVELKSNNTKTALVKVLPKLDDVTTMISTLGTRTNLLTNKSPSISEVELTLNTARSFANKPGKRLVIVTAFNNSIINRILPYFKAKQEIEDKLSSELNPPLGHLIILRPGPIIGQHDRSGTNKPVLQRGSNTISQIILFKKYLWARKRSFISSALTVGLATKISEIIAEKMYHIPGNSLLGYCVPNAKIAMTVAIRATTAEPPNTKVTEIITSREIDELFP